MRGGGFSAGTRWRGWARRYLVAEVAGYAGAVLPALALASGSHLVVAVAATAGEAVAFYGVFAVVRVARAPEGGPRWRRLGSALRQLGAEFGPAGAVNTVVVRPVAIYVALGLLDGVVLGVVAGKLVADVVFLAVTALSYELSTRRRAAPPTEATGVDAAAGAAGASASAAARVATSTAAGHAAAGDVEPAEETAADPAEPNRSEMRERGAAEHSTVTDPEIGAELSIGPAALAGPEARVGGDGGRVEARASMVPSGAFDVDDPFGPERLPMPPIAPGAPYLTIDLGRVTAAYTGLMTALPGVTLAYPIAANAAPDLLRHVGTLGARFVARSLADVRTLGRLGVRAADLRLDTTVLPWWHVRDMHALGVWRFRVDSVVELAKIARYAPGAAVVVPVALDAGRSAGVDADQAYALLVEARSRGLRPWGVSCEIAGHHDGWESPIATCAVVMNRLGLLGVTLSSVDLGEGATVDTAPAAMAALRRHLPYPLTVAASVGRALVAEAGTITATVTGLAWRAGERWLHLDVGGRTGGATLDPDGVAVPLAMSDAGRGEAVPYQVTGPVGDPVDGLGVASLSADLAVGDVVRLHGAGAYTVSAAAPVSGHAPPTTVCTLRGADRAPADAWADWADWTEWEPSGIARGGLAGLAATLAGAKVATDATTGGWRRRPPTTDPETTNPQAADAAGRRTGRPDRETSPTAGQGPAMSEATGAKIPRPRDSAVPDSGGRRALRRSRQPETITIPENDQLFIPVAPAPTTSPHAESAAQHDQAVTPAADPTRATRT